MSDLLELLARHRHCHLCGVMVVGAACVLPGIALRCGCGGRGAARVLQSWSPEPAGPVHCLDCHGHQATPRAASARQEIEAAPMARQKPARPVAKRERLTVRGDD